MEDAQPLRLYKTITVKPQEDGSLKVSVTAFQPAGSIVSNLVFLVLSTIVIFILMLGPWDMGMVPPVLLSVFLWAIILFETFKVLNFTFTSEGLKQGSLTHRWDRFGGFYVEESRQIYDKAGGTRRYDKLAFRSGTMTVKLSGVHPYGDGDMVAESLNDIST